MTPKAPLRPLIDSAPEHVRAVLRSADGDEPTAEQLAAVRAGLAAALAVSAAAPALATPHATAVATAAKGAGLFWVAKVGLATLVLAASAAGVGLAVRHQRFERAAAASPQRARATRDAARLQPSTEGTEGDAPRAPLVATGARDAAPPPAPPSSAAPPALVAGTRRTPHVHAAAPTAPATADAAVAESPFQLVARAQQALRHGDAALALALAESLRDNPAGGDAEEDAQRIAIESLERLGRDAEARVAAQRFFRLFPRSAFRRRIEVVLGDVDAGH